MVSWVLYLATTITWTIFGNILYITLDAGNTGSFLGAVNDYLKQYAHALNANLATYYCTWTSLYIIKLSFMVFFHNLGNNLRAQRILWWTVLGFIVASYAISVGMFDYGCLTSDWKHIIGEHLSLYLLMDRLFACLFSPGTCDTSRIRTDRFGSQKSVLATRPRTTNSLQHESRPVWTSSQTF